MPGVFSGSSVGVLGAQLTVSACLRAPTEDMQSG